MFTFREICMFSAEIWLVKISTRIIKYKSQVIKSNPVCLNQKTAQQQNVIQAFS